MSNPDPTGFFAGQADPEHLPPPVAGGGGDGSSGGTQAQRGKNKSFKDITAAGREQDDHPTWLASPSKPRTGRKPDPLAANVTHPCPECDRQFWSQKALFGHMRCHPERQWRGINPPPHLRRPQPPTSATPCPLPTPGGQGRLPETEREVATCLVMMANGPTPGDTQGLTAEAAGAMDATPPPLSLLLAPVNCRFECSSCKKVFGSHQALGGHRASHKNVKGCFAIARSEGDEASGVSSGNNDTGDDGRTAGEGTVVMGLEQHRCRVCSRAFSSGQALGAHKRRRCERGDEQGAFCSALRSHVPDLNLPPPMENCGSSYDPVLDLKLGI